MGVLRTNNLNVSKIISESYDEATNMSGLEPELRTLVKKVCPMALYIWCHSHRLSLVIEKIIEICGIIKQFFGLLEKIYTFMNGHQ